MLVGVAAQANAADTHATDASALSADARAVVGARSIVAVPDTAETAAAPVELGVVTPAIEKVAEVPVVAPRAVATATNAAPAASVGPVADNPTGSSIVSIALRYLGVPYVWGGTTPNGFDCSGFTQYVYAQAGISIPRIDTQQLAAGRVISADQAVPGDLIWSPGHITIYLGNGQQIEAPTPGQNVQVSNIWQSNPTFVRIG